LRHEGPPVQQEKKNYLKRRNKVTKNENNEIKNDNNVVKRVPIEDEGNCPICQMEISDGDELT